MAKTPIGLGRLTPFRMQPMAKKKPNVIVPAVDLVKG